MRASNYGLNASDYVAHAADNILILAEVESHVAVGNVAEIAAVDGIDGFYIGPLDMSGSVGKLGIFKDPEVEGLLAGAEEAILKSGKALGGSSERHDAARRILDRGYTLVGISSDIELIRNGVRANLENVSST